MPSEIKSIITSLYYYCNGASNKPYSKNAHIHTYIDTYIPTYKHAHTTRSTMADDVSQQIGNTLNAIVNRKEVGT